MNTDTILTISGLALIFTSVLTWLSARYNVSFEDAPRGSHKKLGAKGRKMTFTVTNILFFLGIVLISVSQLIKEDNEKFVTEIPKTDEHIWISMTTIPERLKDPWFRKNLVRTINMTKALKATLILQIPTKSTKGIPYNVPGSIKSLQGPYFKINNCGEDEGPITKILPALRNQNIQRDDIIIVCDDDVVYKKDTFSLLVISVLKQKDAVHVMCNNSLQGYKGFAFRKHALEGLVHIKRPPSCFRIDDDIIAEYIRQHKIELVVAKSGHWTCSMDQKATDTHPKWEELASDDRTLMAKNCIKDLGQLV